MTSAWLVYRIDDLGSRPMVRVLGIYESREAAEADIDVMNDDDWEVVNVPFIGWGVANG